MARDCGRFKRDCDQMKVGLFGTSTCRVMISPADVLLPVGAFLDKRHQKCAQCYQQARSLEQQCQAQAIENEWSLLQTDILTSNFKEIGKWVGVGLLVGLTIYLILR